jgi:chromate transport protein ChrA
MFWIFILITTLALMLVKLGALSVMVTVMSGLLYVALIVIAGLVITFLWRKVFGKQDRTCPTSGANQIQKSGEIQR